MARRDLIVFDFDGTLADTWRDIATALNRTLVEAGLPRADGPEVRAWIGNGVAALIERAAGGADAERLAALRARFREHYARCCLETTALYAGMDTVLAALAGERLAILSNKPERFLVQIAAGLGIDGHFAAIVGGDTLPVQKPDPATLVRVVEVAGGAPERVWMVGDSAVDVATGQRYGARTVGCAWGLRGRAELEEAGADVIIERPEDLLALLAKDAGTL